MHANIYIGEHHLTLCSDWPHISDHGGCAYWASGKCWHYILHPPSSNESTTIGMTIFTVNLVAMSYAYIQYSAKLITLYLVILHLCACV